MKSVILFCSILMWLTSNGQADRLQEVQGHRVMAKYYKQQMIWDSAYYAYRQFVDDKKYANPYDLLDFSCCCLKRSDTARFVTYLSKAIEAGVDTQQISSFYRKVTADERICLDGFLTKNFRPLHEVFLSNYDTTLINGLKLVAERDQVGRGPIEKLAAKDPANWSKSPAYDSLVLIQNPADSMNYVWVMQHFETGRFPGYRYCGAAAANLMLPLLHFDKAYMDWDKAFGILKRAVLVGDMDPSQLASIADRHYLRLAKNPCYYYGSLKWGDQPFYDCKNVDRLRAEIGLERLKTEYERQKRVLPACYGG
jgi:hypothetical protein